MKKYFSLISLLVIMMSCGSESDLVFTDTYFQQLKGPVKSVEEFSYRAVESAGEYVPEENGEYNHIKRIFNTDGNREELTFYGDNDRIDVRLTYEYDKHLLREIRTFDNEARLMSRTDVIVDENNKVLMMTEYDPEENIISKSVYTYEGDTTHRVDKFGSNDDIVIGITESTYEGNRYIKYEDFGPDGSLRYRTTPTYDRDGLEIKNVTEFLEDSFTDTNINYFEHELDDEGNWTKRLVFDEDRVIKSIVIREITYHD